MHLIISADNNARNSVLTFEDLDSIKKNLLCYDYKVDINQINIDGVKSLLIDNNSLFINLISNKNILQHEIFTDLLMSVIHLRDEIIFMENDIHNELDMTHLENDIVRVYRNISIQWIDYLEYLQKNYPFLYNNAIRINPFKFN